MRRDRGRGWPFALLLAVLLCVGEPASADHSEEVDEFIREHILPRENRLASATLRLQNAVVRHCTVPGPTTLNFVSEAFAGVLIASAATAPLASIAGVGRRSPESFVTGVAQTAFSRSRLGAMVAGTEEPALTLSALLDEEPALTGLPALEFLLRPPEIDGAEFERRCLMAKAIVAGLRERARSVAAAWTISAVPEHWRDTEAPLADRRRLRDLIQGAIAVADRLDRLLAEFDRQRENNEELPFLDGSSNLIYIAALMEGLARHVERLIRYSESGDDANEVLLDAGRSLDLARSRFNRDIDDHARIGEVRPIMGAARLAMIQRLPAAFGFDRRAFSTPLGTIADLRSQSEDE